MPFLVERQVYSDWYVGLGGTVVGGAGTDRFQLVSTASDPTSLIGRQGGDVFEMTAPLASDAPPVTLFGGRGADWFTLEQGPVVAWGGAGEDHMTLMGRYGHGVAELNGGAGEDRVAFHVPDRAATLDVADGALWLDGARIATFEAFETVSVTAAATMVTLRGTDARDNATLDTRWIDADLGAGQDVVHLHGPVSGHIDFGLGWDILTLRADLPLWMDRANGFADFGVEGRLTFNTVERLTVWPGAGADRLAGGVGHDALYGGAGRDWLNGRRGPDVLHGGDGTDTLRGGKGADTFVFNTGEAGTDLVVDFGAQDAVKVGYSGYNPKYPVPGIVFFDGMAFGGALTEMTSTIPAIFYDSTTGHLTVDLDGIGPQSAEPLAILLDDGAPADLALDQISYGPA